MNPWPAFFVRSRERDFPKSLPVQYTDRQATREMIRATNGNSPRGKSKARGMDLEAVTHIEQWEQWHAEGKKLLPMIVKTRPGPSGLPPAWTRAWDGSPYSVVLESGKGGRYTYLAVEPVSILQGKENQAKITDPSQPNRVETVLTGKPLEVLKQWTAPYEAPRLVNGELPPFVGGCIGFLGYDAVRSLERLPVLAADEPGFPDYLWMRFEELWIYDHAENILYCTVHSLVDGAGPDAGHSAVGGQQAAGHAAKGAPAEDAGTNITGGAAIGYAGTDAARETAAGHAVTDAAKGAAAGLREHYVLAQKRAERMAGVWKQLHTAPPAIEPGPEAEGEAPASGPWRGEWPGMRSAFSQPRFEDAVRRIQEYIRQGDVFQVNLSLRQESQLAAPPELVYEWLRALNPSPYMGLLRSPGFTLASASPELLVKLHGDRVSARPIAGTRRRGRSSAEDAAMEAELRGTEKEIAEHIMLVDLERNDIGRIAAYGSVRVPELMTVERYSHVMHLVSQVEGTLAAGKDAYDTIAALFPGGTITGAPKIRTMEIIEELEPVRRGPYTGSMGWIDYGGNMELNIIIRTLAVKEGIGYIQTGAGIVIDSDPYREYRECYNKAKAVVQAVLRSERQYRTSGGKDTRGSQL